MARLGRWLAAAVLLVVASACVAHARLPVSPSTPHLYPSSAVRHLEPVRAFRVKHADMHLASPNVRTVDGHVRPYPDAISIEFEAFGEQHSYDLEIFSPFEAHTTITVVGENDVEENVPYTVTTYRKMFDNGDWVTATLRDDGTMHASVKQGDSLLSVDPISVHARELHKSVFHQLSASARHGMVAFRSADMILDGDNLHQCGEAPAPPKEAARTATINYTASARGPARHLLALVPWEDCRSPFVAMKFFTGVGIDYGFYKAAGNSVAAVNSYIAQLYANMNTVYLAQMNIYLIVDATIMNTAGGKGTYPWNEDRTSAACPSINALLDVFTNWRKTAKPSTQGVWHHFTDCYPPPGTVGLAWLGVLCSITHGAGVSSISSSMWLTVAHELGHNFDAGHTFSNPGQGTTGGIMDYGDGKLNGEYQFYRSLSSPTMCAEIRASMGTSRSGLVPYAACWATYAPACGNGIVEAGEGCDDAGVSGCCNMATCQLNAGAQCTTGECCSSCKYLATTSRCGGGAGYCNNGECTQSFCNRYSGMSYCGTMPTNACKQQCNLNGVCTDVSRYTDSGTGQPLPVGIANGAACNLSPFSTCVNAVCTPSVTVTYSWSTGVWGTCSVTCGTGTQTRSVECRDNSNNVAAESACSGAGTKPAASQSCDAAQVCARWQASSFSQCTNDCGTGTQSATLTCVATVTGAVVANSLCAGQTAPVTQRACNTLACPVAWSTTVWSNCNKLCGAGIQTRTSTCMQTQNGAQTPTTASLCGPAPLSQQSCNTPACAVYDWQIANWGACSKDCVPLEGTSGVQTRVVACYETTTNTPASSPTQCTTTAPATSQPCNTQACPVWGWKNTTWSSCSVSCGGGTRTRLVNCYDFTNEVQVADEWCNMIRLPQSEACNTPVCPSYRWVSSAWSACPVTCGGGSSTRTNACWDNNDAVVTPGFCAGQTAPSTSQACNIQACPTYSWYSGAWSTCSATCGGGSYTRTVECRLDGSVTAVAASLCVTASKPAATGTCNTFVCGTYTWSAGTWSDCSQACGGGQRYRVVNCVDQAGATVGVARCTGTAPSTQESCNTDECPVYWSAGEYGACSKPCGTGTKTRTVVCRQVSGDVVVDSSRCLGSPLSTITDCNPQLCPTWQPQEWGVCSERCGDGIANRTIPCIDYQGFEVDIAQCTDHIPSQTRPCNNLPCPHWHHNDWLPCPVVCGGGVQTRTTACRMPHDDPAWQGRLAMDATLCAGEPDLTRACNVDPCTPFYWGPTTEYTTCSATCGGGTQTATIACIDAATGQPAANSARCIGSAPSGTRSCNTWPCPVYEWHLLDGDVWSECSSTCGAGIQKRNVVCRNKVGLISIVAFEIVADSYCAEFAKPESTRICSGTTCGLHGFCQNAKCVCSGGYTGERCGASPIMGLMTSDAAYYTSGVPSGEQLTLRWTATGDIPTVSLLIKRAAWVHPIYIARAIPNSGIYLWTVPSSLAAAADYTLITYYSSTVHNSSSSLEIADPCNYLSCGQFGTCSAGRCVCSPGYTGTLCTVSACSAANCNQFHSTCTPGSGVCTCTGGWLGPQCNTPPKCTSSCLHNGYQVQKIGAADGVCSDCICPNSWSGPTCGTCSLQCANGFSPDADCNKCNCGTNSGYFGDKCECRYNIGSIKLLTSGTDSWIADNSTAGALHRFNETFGYDMAASIPGSKLANFQVISVAPTTGGVTVSFRIAHDCAVTSGDSDLMFPAAGRRLLQSSGDSPSIANMTATIYLQLRTSDSQLMRGVVTSAAEASSFTSTTPIHDGGGSGGSGSTSVDTTAILIGVGVGVGVLLIASVGCWCNSRAKAAQKDNEMLKQHTDVALASPRAVQQTSSPQSTTRLQQQPSSPTSPSSNLPPNWTEQRTDTGDRYYYNSVTGVSEWTRPTA